jgi:lipopolysaccharide transport system permease protein
MIAAVKALQFGWTSRRAWWFIATARTQERFARAVLGSFWLGLSNLFSIGVLALVYGTVFKVADFTAYVVYLGTGLVIWNAIATAIQSAPNLFRVNAGNVKNTNIPPIFYSLEEWSFQVQTFLQSFSLVLLVLTFFQSSLWPHLLTAGSLPLVNLLIFIYWFPLLLCLLGARYEDLFQLVPIFLQLMFLLSPILYQKVALGKFAWTADFNPIFWLLNDFRVALLFGEFKLESSLLLLLVNCIGVIASVALLERERSSLPFLV